MITNQQKNKTWYEGDFEDALKNLKAATKNAPNFSGYVPPDNNLGNNASDKIKSVSGMATSGADALLGTALNGLSGLSSNLAFNMPTFGKTDVDKDDDEEGIIPELIKLIKAIVHLPMRFMNMSKSLAFGTVALATGIEGLAKSAILGTKDIITLIIAIIRIVAKYFICILSITITTIAGCFLIHGVTFMFYVMYLIFPASGYFVELATGIDIMPTVDAMFEMLGEIDNVMGQYTGGIYAMKWPDAISNICYTCFGEHVQIRDVLVDVDVIKDIGEQMSFDFGKVIPGYMSPSQPYGHTSMQYLDKALN